MLQIITKVVLELLERDKARNGSSTTSNGSQNILCEPLNDLQALKNFDAMLRDGDDRCTQFVSIHIIDFIFKINCSEYFL